MTPYRIGMGNGVVQYFAHHRKDIVQVPAYHAILPVAFTLITDSEEQFKGPAIRIRAAVTALASISGSVRTWT